MHLRTLHDKEAFDAGVASWGSDLEADAAIAEALRGELWARRTVTRRALCQRVVGLMSSVREVDLDSVTRVLSTLELDGDVTVGDRGLIAAAPIRAVKLEDGTYLLAGGPDTARLQQLLGGSVASRVGLRAATDPSARFHRAVESAGGVVLTPERWAGLDRIAPADAEWIQALDADFEYAADGKSVLPAECGEWRCYVPEMDVGVQRKRWMKPTEHSSARLWRARHDRGYSVSVWTGGEHPENGRHVSLSGDAACRATFALDRAAGNAVRWETTLEQDAVWLNTGGMIPRAEYRFLLTCGTRTEDHDLRYRFNTAVWPKVSSTLASRLGVLVGQEAES